MKFLFYDLECANIHGGTGKICEFGYCVTDETFNIIDEDIFIINPKDEFDKFVIDNLLAYKKIVYDNSPDFTAFYDKIASLLSCPNQIIVGHSIDGDASHINDECRRYNLPFINYNFYDVKFMFADFKRTSRISALVLMCKELGVNKPLHEHRSCDDAHATMLCTKALCLKANLSLTCLIASSKNCAGKSFEGSVSSDFKYNMMLKRCEPPVSNKMNNMNKKRFAIFISNVKPIGKIIPSSISGKKISFCNDYESSHYRQMLSLVQLIYNHGAFYENKASNSDIFVSFKTNINNCCSRKFFVEDAISHGRNISIIPFNQFLNILGVSQTQLDNMPYPDFRPLLLHNF